MFVNVSHHRAHLRLVHFRNDTTYNAYVRTGVHTEDVGNLMSELVVNYRYQRDVVERAHACTVRRDSDFTIRLTETQFTVYLGQSGMKTRSFGGFQYREELTVLLSHHVVGQIAFESFNKSIRNGRTGFNNGRFARRGRCCRVCIQNN